MTPNKAAVTIALFGFVSMAARAQEPASDLHEAQASDPPREALLASSRLELAERNDNTIAGTLDGLRAGQRLSFTSSLVSPTEVRLRVETGDTVLEAQADLKAGTRVLDGQNHGLTAEERANLRALVAQLETQLQPYSNALAAHEDLLFRVANYYADAPVGWPLRRASPMTRADAAHALSTASGKERR